MAFRSFVWAPCVAFLLAACSVTGGGGADGETEAGESSLNGVDIRLLEHTMKSTAETFANADSIRVVGRELQVWLSTSLLPTDGYDVGFVDAKVENGELLLTAAALAPPTGCATNRFSSMVSAWYAVTLPVGAYRARIAWADGPQKRRAGTKCDPFEGTARVAWAASLPRATAPEHVALRATESDVFVRGPRDLFAIGASGETRWKIERTTETNELAIEVDETNVYAACNGLCAFRRTDGRLVWEVAGKNASPSAPARGPSGSLYFGSGDLFAVGKSGRLVWSKQVAGFHFGGPRVATDGTIYAVAESDTVADDRRLHAYRPNGAELWNVPLQGARLLDAGTEGAYVATASGVTLVSPLGAVVRSHAGLANRHGVAGANGGLVSVGDVAAQATSPKGDVLWSYAATPNGVVGAWKPSFARPVVDTEGHVHLVASTTASGGPVVELDAAGQEISRLNLPTTGYAIDVAASGAVYVAGDRLYAVATSTPVTP